MPTSKLKVSVAVDIRNEKLGKKIRDGETTKTPYMIIVGEKEQEEGAVNIRSAKPKIK